MHSTFLTLQAGQMGGCNMEVTYEIIMTIYFTVNAMSCTEIIFHPKPWKPPDGITLHIIMIFMISSNFSTITT